MKKLTIPIVTALIIFFADQWTKCLTVMYLKGHESLVLIKDVLELTYCENSGAAFSMLEGRQTFFMWITIAAVTVMLVFILVMKGLKPFPSMVLGLILGGTLGNFYDRILLGYVVDMVYVSAIDFAVFNLADAALTVGTITLAVMLLFTKTFDGVLVGDKQKSEQEAVPAEDKKEELPAEAPAEAVPEAASEPVAPVAEKPAEDFNVDEFVERFTGENAERSLFSDEDGKLFPDSEPVIEKTPAEAEQVPDAE